MPYLSGGARSATPVTSVYGRNNYAVIDQRYRYIRYEDGSEELYDHENDPNEWNNLAGRADYSTIKQRLASFVPSNTAESMME
jgi:hypothetical protein